ncbi:MAG: hypothetical protein OEY29_11005 [Gammaproteobacteria bacterium]|nr:hypothetical protein [Gammaproteobacteria bacterium]
MSYQLIWNEKGATAEFKGTINLLELKEILSQFYGSPKFDEIRYLIINLLEVDKLEITDSNFRLVGAMDAAAAISNPHIKIAVITENKKVLELFESYEKGASSSSWEVKYFPNLNNANNWLLA